MENLFKTVMKKEMLSTHLWDTKAAKCVLVRKMNVYKKTLKPIILERAQVTFILTTEKSYSIQIPNSAQTPSCTVRLKHHSIMKKKNLFWSDLLSKNLEDLYFIIFLSLISHLWISLWPSDESPRICMISKLVFLATFPGKITNAVTAVIIASHLVHEVTFKWSIELHSLLLLPTRSCFLLGTNPNHRVILFFYLEFSLKPRFQ